MPEKAEAYEIDGSVKWQADQPFAAWARGKIHEVGLTAAQAKALSAAYNAYGTEQATAADSEYKLLLAADEKSLQSEWRGGHDRMMNLARTAAKELGFSKPVFD